MIWSVLCEMTFLEPLNVLLWHFVPVSVTHCTLSVAKWFVLGGLTLLDNPFNGVWQSIHISPCSQPGDLSPNSPVCWIFHLSPGPSVWFQIGTQFLNWCVSIHFGLSKFSESGRFWRKTHSNTIWKTSTDNACKMCVLGIWVACYFSNTRQHFCRKVSPGSLPSWDWYCWWS